MGFVYRARDERLERAVAIKILAPGLLTGEDARRRFHKEALALAKLSNTHIAAVYDVGEQDGVDYIVMECVPGESLAAKLRSGPLTVKEATSITMQIAEALEEAHEQGVIHRAPEAGERHGHAEGTGGGRRLRSGEATRDPGDRWVPCPLWRRAVCWALHFTCRPNRRMERELMRERTLWSLGVVYYEMLTGRRPFQGDGIIGVLRAITEKAPIPMRQIRFDAPPLADQIIVRALEKDRSSLSVAFGGHSRHVESFGRDECVIGSAGTSVEAGVSQGRRRCLDRSCSRGRGGYLALPSLVDETVGPGRGSPTDNEPLCRREATGGIPGSRKGGTISAVGPRN